MDNNENNVVNESQNQQPVQNQTPAESPKKGNKTALIVIIVGAVLLLLIGALIFIAVKVVIPKLQEQVNASKEITNVKENVKKAVEDTKKDVKDATEKVKGVTGKSAKESKIDSPLKIGEWGFASKYVSEYQSKEYKGVNSVDVPVRITKVTRGEKATKIVKEWVDSKKYYKYEEPKAHTEWAVVEYEVDLSNVKFDSDGIGTAIKVDSAIRGTDGSSLKYDGIIYIITTTDASSSDYVKEPGVYSGKFITTLPEGCKDYIIKMGNSYNGAESFFKGE